jgi:hypothetical protein
MHKGLKIKHLKKLIGLLIVKKQNIKTCMAKA